MQGTVHSKQALQTLIDECAAKDPLRIADRSFRSRLFVGTGKFASVERMKQAIDESCSEMVTVALRRIDLTKSSLHDEDIIAALDRNTVQLLPNTSGARNADEAVRLAMLAREMGGGTWVKLEVTPDPVYLLPDPGETLKATEILVREGFTVLPYMQADPILALRLQDAGAATVMPLGSPIGSNRGIRTEDHLRIIIEQASVPVVVDAGLGAPSHAALAFELGADAVLVNTALAIAADTGRTARSFALAALAGRQAFLFGMESRQPTGSLQAVASSPLTGFLNQEER